jgi:hypothetical protein
MSVPGDRPPEKQLLFTQNNGNTIEEIIEFKKTGKYEYAASRDDKQTKRTDENDPTDCQNGSQILGKLAPHFSASSTDLRDRRVRRCGTRGSHGLDELEYPAIIGRTT